MNLVGKTFSSQRKIYTGVSRVSRTRSQSQKATKMKRICPKNGHASFQSDEIASAQLVAGEEEQLLEERNKLNNFQKIADALTISYAALNGEDDSSLDKIGTSMNELASIESLDPEYKSLSDTVQNAYYLLQEASGDLSRLIDGLELDEGRLNEVENRLELIRQMKRKYGDSIETILSYYEEITKELAEADFWKAVQVT